MRTLNRTLSITGSAIAASLLLSACSDGGTVTTLDARPSVSIGLPQVLLDATSIGPDNISPTIQLSNGASVTMHQDEGDAWSGTINVAPDANYTATLIWSESVEGQALPLASLQQTLEVAADGTVNVTSTSNYSTEMDADNDGISNLAERESGTDPYHASSEERLNEPANAADDNQPETPAPDNSDPAPDNSQNPSTDDPIHPLEQEQEPEPTNPAVPTATPDSPVADSPVIDSNTNPVVDNTPIQDPTQAATPDSPLADPTQTTPASSIADTVVPRIATSDAPMIDGSGVTIDSEGQLTGEWAAAVQADSSGKRLLIDKLIVDTNAENPDGAPYRRWAAMHDGKHLYVVVIVDDNGDRQRDSLSDLTQDDSLELFLDGDNSKTSVYGNDDFHRIFPVRLPGIDKRSADTGDIAGPNSSPIGFVVTFATGPGIGPQGIRRANWEQDVYELKIELSSAGINTNSAFGFELQINDDDGGGGRDSKWAWKLPSRSDRDVDETVEDPSTMGTLKLE